MSYPELSSNYMEPHIVVIQHKYNNLFFIKPYRLI